MSLAASKSWAAISCLRLSQSAREISSILRWLILSLVARTWSLVLGNFSGEGRWSAAYERGASICWQWPVWVCWISRSEARAASSKACTCWTCWNCTSKRHGRSRLLGISFAGFPCLSLRNCQGLHDALALSVVQVHLFRSREGRRNGPPVLCSNWSGRCRPSGGPPAEERR